MNGEFIAAILFVLLLSLFLFVKRKNVHVQKLLFPLFYFIMYKTSVGLPQMDCIAQKYPRALKVFAYFSIITGFVGMVLITYVLLQNLYNMLFIEEAVSGVGLVLPFKVKGGFYVPFFYWITSIILIAAVHEFSHGVLARYYAVKIKSSGFAFMAILVPIIPAAFVEPDEKKIVKKSWKEQVAVYSAGPASNVIFGVVALLLLIFLIAPITNSMLETNGLKIASVSDQSPAHTANLSVNEIIFVVDGQTIKDPLNFTEAIRAKKPGEVITLKTDKKEYAVTLAAHPTNASRAYIGLSVLPETKVTKESEETFGSFLPAALLWIGGLLYWLYLLNIGIGIFNLVPLGPIDGGRMMYATLEKYLPKEKSKKIGSIISFFFLVLILANVLGSFF